MTHKPYTNYDISASPYHYIIYWIFMYRGIPTYVLYSFVKGHRKGPVSYELNVSLNKVYDYVRYYYYYLFIYVYITMHIIICRMIQSQRHSMEN